MARHFTVTLTSGTNPGPYTIYHSAISSSNVALKHGTTDPSENLTLQEVQTGVMVSVPDEATSVILYNTNANVIADCPINFVEYPLGANPTSTPLPTSTPNATPPPTPNATPQPTPNPTATDGSTPTPSPSSSPTPTPSTTASPTPSPSPSTTASPTPSPTITSSPTPTPSPTPTTTDIPTAFCEFVWVGPEVDQSKFGLRYINPVTGQQNTVFNSMFGTPYTYNNTEGIVYGVCSTILPNIWNSNDGTSTPIDGITVVSLGQGGVCTDNIDCMWELTPTETPSPTVTPAPTQTAICEFIWVSPEVNINVYGLRYFDQANGIIETRFSQLLGSPLTYDGVEGTVYGVCSTNIPQIWDSSNNTTSPPDGVSTVLLAQGGVCVEDRNCVYQSTPEPTAQPTSTPQPTSSGECLAYDISNRDTVQTLYIEYTDCNENQTLTAPFGPDSDATICSLTVPVRTAGSNSYTISAGYVDPDLCGGGPSATPAPTSTPNATPNPTPNPTGTQSVSFLAGSECYEFKLSHHPSSTTVCTNVQGGVGFVNYYMSNGTFNELTTGGIGYIIYINDGVTTVGDGYLSDGCQWWQTNGFGEIIANGSCNGGGPCCDSVIGGDPGPSELT